MSERWIRDSEKILEEVKRQQAAKNRDRLELVRSMLFLLNVLQRSLLGWMQWANTPDIMTRFTRDELGEMAEKLTHFTQAFVEYDLEATKLGNQKGLKMIRKIELKKREADFYIQ